MVEIHYISVGIYIFMLITLYIGFVVLMAQNYHLKSEIKKLREDVQFIFLPSENLKYPKFNDQDNHDTDQ